MINMGEEKKGRKFSISLLHNLSEILLLKTILCVF